MPEVNFSPNLPAWQKFLISLVLVVIVVIAWMVSISSNLGVEVLGMFIQISGILLLSLGLVRTNEDVLVLARHHKHKDEQAIVTRHSSERFQIMLGLFLMVLGLLLQIFGTVL